MKKDTSGQLRTAICVVLILWIVSIVYWIYRTPLSAPWMLLRAAALLGYSTLFLSILSSEYIREMRKLFGRPFLRVHHILAVVGLVLTLVHPLTYAVISKSLSVFLHVEPTLRGFFTFAGRPALYLIWIAALAAVARRRIKDVWKFIHWLNYLAFALIFVHSWLLGQDIAAGPPRLISLAMVAIVLGVLVHKRLLSRPQKA
jgi:sulfoxide reductase heme-binding subunit YedZ